MIFQCIHQKGERIWVNGRLIFVCFLGSLLCIFGHMFSSLTFYLKIASITQKFYSTEISVSGFLTCGFLGFFWRHPYLFEKSLEEQEKIKYEVVNIVNNIVPENTYQVYMGDRGRSRKITERCVSFPLCSPDWMLCSDRAGLPPPGPALLSTAAEPFSCSSWMRSLHLPSAQLEYHPLHYVDSTPPSPHSLFSSFTPGVYLF